MDLWTIEQPAQYPGDRPTDILLFEKVATLDKGPQVKKGTVKGNREHREWYQALERATYPRVTLKLAWRNKEKDRKEETEMSEADQLIDCEEDSDMYEVDQSVVPAVKNCYMENEGDSNKGFTGMERPMTPDSITEGCSF
jgi:hypothetical protein